MLARVPHNDFRERGPVVVGARGHVSPFRQHHDGALMCFGRGQDLQGTSPAVGGLHASEVISIGLKMLLPVIAAVPPLPVGRGVLSHVGDGLGSNLIMGGSCGQRPGNAMEEAGAVAWHVMLLKLGRNLAVPDRGSSRLLGARRGTLTFLSGLRGLKHRLFDGNEGFTLVGERTRSQWLAPLAHRRTSRGGKNPV